MNANNKPLFPRLAAAITRLPAGTLTILTILAILWLTLAPDPLPSTGMKLFPGADKVVHACMFGGLFFMVYLDRDGTYRKRRTPWNPAQRMRFTIFAAMGCALFGGAIELAQDAMRMGRSADWLDFVADGAGVALATVLTPWIVRRLFTGGN